MRKILTIGIIAALLCGIGLANTTLAATPQTGNNSQDKPHFDYWVESKNMSNYSIYNPPNIVKPVFDKAWQLANPGSYIIDPSKPITKNITILNNSQFLSNHTLIIKRTPAQISQLIQSAKTNSITLNDTLNSMSLTPSVFMTEAAVTWLWVQDQWGDNEVTIYNAGSSAASGYVIVWSWEDGYGYGNTYSNLAAGTSTTVSVPFKPRLGTSVGIKPMVIEIADSNQVALEIVQLSPDGIETYNNAAGYLTDPDGGDSLETSDLYHFPYSSGYPIIHEAAVAGDDTSTPYSTAEQETGYVYNKMHPNYNLSNPASNYTASDLWITNNGYTGVCDEFATLFTSFDRSLGIPTRFYLINMNNSTNATVGHGISEIWDGNKWVHADPTWNVFNNSQIYKQHGYSHIHMWRMSDANDSLYMGDPYGDGLLDYWSDFGVKVNLGEPSAYN